MNDFPIHAHMSDTVSVSESESESGNESKEGRNQTLTHSQCE